MAKKTNKTAHVLNLLTEKPHTAGPDSAVEEEEGAPAHSAEKPPRSSIPVMDLALENDNMLADKIQSALLSELDGESPAPTPVEPAPAPAAEPMPASAEPALVEPAPVEPVPAPVEPAPAPVEPVPAPVESVPAPVEPAPAPVEPAPAPVEPAPAPVEPVPAPVEPVPTPAPVEPVSAPVVAPVIEPAAAPTPAAATAVDPEEFAPLAPQTVSPTPKPPVDPVTAALEPILTSLNGELTYVNVMEALVVERADSYMSRLCKCRCPRCRVDIIALSLSRLPSKYVVMHRSAMIPMLTLYDTLYKSDISVALTQSCIQVSQFPRH